MSLHHLVKYWRFYDCSLFTPQVEASKMLNGIFDNWRGEKQQQSWHNTCSTQVDLYPTHMH